MDNSNSAEGAEPKESEVKLNTYRVDIALYIMAEHEDIARYIVDNILGDASVTNNLLEGVEKLEYSIDFVEKMNDD